MSASKHSSTGAPAQGSAFASGPLKDAFKPEVYDPAISNEQGNGACSGAKWGLTHFQWSLALFSMGVLIATAYASQSMLDMVEVFKEIIGKDTLNLNSDTADLMDTYLDSILSVSWFLAGGAIIGALHPSFYPAIPNSTAMSLHAARLRSSN